LIKFSISLTLLAITLLEIVYAAQKHDWFNSSPSYALEIVSFLGISMVTIFYFLNKRSDSSSFTQAYLLSIFLKMLLYSGVILFIILKDRTGAVGNVILFLVCYVLFTALEVGFLFKAVNK
jgi:hypothetical protein